LKMPDEKLTDSIMMTIAPKPNNSAENPEARVLVRRFLERACSRATLLYLAAGLLLIVAIVIDRPRYTNRSSARSGDHWRTRGVCRRDGSRVENGPQGRHAGRG